MKTPIGKKVQGLEREIIQNLVETKLVEHPHFYHRNLKDPTEPLILSYKVTVAYITEIDSYDPLIEVFPFEEFLKTGLPGIPVIESHYDSSTGVHTLKIGLDSAIKTEAIDFKYQVLLKINVELLRYLKDSRKIPVVDREKNHKQQIENYKKIIGRIPKKKSKRKKRL